MFSSILLLTHLLLLNSQSFATEGKYQPPSHVQIELISEQNAIEPGGIVTVALRLKMDNGWHTYWRNPGDSGMSTSLEWNLPAGFSVSHVQWPYPSRFVTPSSVSYGYSREASLLCDLHAPAQLRQGETIELSAKVKWLECREICVPGHAVLSLHLPVQSAEAKNPATVTFFTQARSRLPRTLGAGMLAGWSAQAFRKSGTIQLRLTPSFANKLHPIDLIRAEFFPYEDGVIANDQPQHLRVQGKSLILEMVQSRAPGADQAPQLFGVLVFRREDMAMELSLPIKNSTSRRKST